GAVAARSAADPQVVAWLAMQATLLLGEGRTGEASALLDEVSAAGAFEYYFMLDFALAIAEVGRAEELAAWLPGAEIGQAWLDVGRALVAGDFARAVDCYAELGLATYEARARLRAACELVAAGRRREADEHLS